jgi:hypothetical protein
MASRTSFPGQFESFQAKSSAIAAASFTEIRNQSVHPGLAAGGFSMHPFVAFGAQRD